jgi:hypothetical protein
MQLITSFAVLATAVSTAHALGNAIIHNKCPYDVYLWPTDANRAPTQPQVISSGSTYSEGYHTPSTGGVSLKLSKSTSCASGYITQFEYTVSAYSGTNFLWYDGSNVDCTAANCPFQQDGVFLTTSKGSNSACKECSCPPSTSTTEKCDCFYKFDVDDKDSFSCDDSADTIMYLCATSATGGSSVPAVVSQAAAVVSSYIAPVVPTTTSTSSAAPSSSKAVAVQMNEAPVTMITVTKGAWRPKHTKRALPHAHARRHQH